MNLIVVTNPELGWDCVMAVYDASKISEDDVKKLYSEECVTHYTGITKAPKKKKKKAKSNDSDIKVLEVFEYSDSIGCVIDHLVGVSDCKPVMEILYDIENDNGRTMLYSEELFITLDEDRNNKLNELGI